jgi:hypothetical protein
LPLTAPTAVRAEARPPAAFGWRRTGRAGRLSARGVTKVTTGGNGVTVVDSANQIVKPLDKPQWIVAQRPLSQLQYPDIVESSFHDCRAV